jgi:septum formation protein
VSELGASAWCASLGTMLILASASPRRRELLTQIGVAHTIRPAHIDESQLQGEDAVAYVRRLALEKAQVVARELPDNAVLAADTTVVLGREILGKPNNTREAGEMLRVLAGQVHQVHTGVAVSVNGHASVHVETTAVTFTEIAEDELATYIATGDSLDKAGAYGIQGYAARWISRIEGDYFNVVGLPLAATVRLLREAGALVG